MPDAAKPPNNFGWALQMLQAGQKVRRPTFESGMYIELRDGKELFVTIPSAGMRMPTPIVYMSDVLANDWELMT